LIVSQGRGRVAASSFFRGVHDMATAKMSKTGAVILPKVVGEANQLHAIAMDFADALHDANLPRVIAF
jgi:hypothetical protein